MRHLTCVCHFYFTTVSYLHLFYKKESYVKLFIRLTYLIAHVSSWDVFQTLNIRSFICLYICTVSFSSEKTLLFCMAISASVLVKKQATIEMCNV